MSVPREPLVIGHSLVELVERLHDRFLRETAGVLDQYYIQTRYPNGLAGGVPFGAFGERQAREEIEGAGKFVAIAQREAGKGAG